MVSGKNYISKKVVEIRKNWESEAKLRPFPCGHTQIGRYFLKLILLCLKFLTLFFVVRV